jgi:hypothetical protein
MASPAELAVELFRSFDANGEGTIKADMLRKVLRRIDAEFDWEFVMKAVATNANGKVCYKDFVSWLVAEEQPQRPQTSPAVCRLGDPVEAAFPPRPISEEVPLTAEMVAAEKSCPMAEATPPDATTTDMPVVAESLSAKALGVEAIAAEGFATEPLTADTVAGESPAAELLAPDLLAVEALAAPALAAVVAPSAEVPAPEPPITRASGAEAVPVEVPPDTYADADIEQLRKIAANALVKADEDGRLEKVMTNVMPTPASAPAEGTLAPVPAEADTPPPIPSRDLKVLAEDDEEMRVAQPAKSTPTPSLTETPPAPMPAEADMERLRSAAASALVTAADDGRLVTALAKAKTATGPDATDPSVETIKQATADALVTAADDGRLAAALTKQAQANAVDEEEAAGDDCENSEEVERAKQQARLALQGCLLGADDDALIGEELEAAKLSARDALHAALIAGEDAGNDAGQPSVEAEPVPPPKDVLTAEELDCAKSQAREALAAALMSNGDVDVEAPKVSGNDASQSPVEAESVPASNDALTAEELDYAKSQAREALAEVLMSNEDVEVKAPPTQGAESASGGNQPPVAAEPVPPPKDPFTAEELECAKSQAREALAGALMSNEDVEAEPALAQAADSAGVELEMAKVSAREALQTALTLDEDARNNVCHSPPEAYPLGHLENDVDITATAQPKEVPTHASKPQPPTDTLTTEELDTAKSVAREALTAVLISGEGGVVETAPAEEEGSRATELEAAKVSGNNAKQPPVEAELVPPPKDARETLTKGLVTNEDVDIGAVPAQATGSASAKERPFSARTRSVEELKERVGKLEAFVVDVTQGLGSPYQKQSVNLKAWSGDGKFAREDGPEVEFKNGCFSLSDSNVVSFGICNCPEWGKDGSLFVYREELDSWQEFGYKDKGSSPVLWKRT